MEEYYFTLSCRTKPAILLKVTFVHECFSRFLNCTNGSKPGKASHMLTFEREAYRVHFDGGLLGDRFARMRACVCVCVCVCGGGGAEGCRSVSSNSFNLSCPVYFRKLHHQNTNFCFRTSLSSCLKRFYEGLKGRHQKHQKEV